MFFHGEVKNKIMDYWTDDVQQAGGGTSLRHSSSSTSAPTRSASSHRDPATAGRPGTPSMTSYNSRRRKARSFCLISLVEQYGNPVCSEGAGFSACGTAPDRCFMKALRRQLADEVGGQVSKI